MGDLPWLRKLRRSAVIHCIQVAAETMPGQTGLATALMCIVAALPALAIVATGALIQGAVSSFRGAPAGRGDGLVIAFIAWASMMLLNQILPRVLAALATSFGAEVENRISERVMSALNRPWSIAHLEDPTTANFISQVSGIGLGGYGPGAAIHGLITGRVTSTLRAVVSGALLVPFHWWAAALLFAAQLAFASVARRTYVMQANTMLGRTAAVRRTDYLRELALGPAAAKDMRILGLGGWLGDRMVNDWSRGLSEEWRAQRTGFRLSLLTAAIVTGANVFVFVLLARAAAAGDITIGKLVIFLGAAQAIAGLNALGTTDYAIEYGSAAVPALLELEAIAGSQEPDTPSVQAPLGRSLPRGEITFENVSFRYPRGTASVLASINLQIPAGRSTAIVGLNGAGKTTVVKLLARLYDPTEGAVKVGEQDLRDLDARAWRRGVAAIFQDFLRFDLSVRDNIAFGAVHLAADQSALDRAAKKAGILEQIQALPNGWETPLSRAYAGGVDLSGGQWQRVALARALFAVEGGANLLILDEPTASLDARAEAELYERFLEFTQGLTTIIISHRFSTVRRANQICVLSDGVIREVGTHAQLVAGGGLYAELFAMQAAHFVEPAP